MIDQATIDQVKQQVDLYAVISRLHDLKRSGSGWVGLCPFHAEKTPSFRVTPDKGTWHCFGCGLHGDAFEFLQRHQGISFAEAVEQLAGQAGIPVGREARGPSTPRYEAKFVPPKSRPSETVPVGQEAQAALDLARGHLGDAGAYLAGRRIPVELARRYGAGFLRQGESIEPGFSGPRVVFPLTAPDGQIVNVYGRSTDPQASKKDRHRALSRPKGLFNAPALALDGPLWIVEGTFDAMALLAAGIEKVVAPIGLEGFDWAWLRGQREIVIGLDTDDAGRQAAEKMRDEARYRGHKASILDVACYGGCKDVSEAWAAHALVLPGQERADPHADLKASIRAIGDAPEASLAKAWPTFKAMVDRFATLHLEAALGCGWTVEELFALPVNPAGFGSGALWTFAAFRVARFEVMPDALVAVTEDGSRLVQRRGQTPAGPLPWPAP